MPSNRIDAVLLGEQIEKFNTGFTMMSEALPFLIDLTPQERADMKKFGEKNRSFVIKALAIAQAHPEILPASFDQEEFRKDVELVESLYPLRNIVEKLFGRTGLAAPSVTFESGPILEHPAQHQTLRRGTYPVALRAA